MSQPLFRHWKSAVAAVFLAGGGLLRAAVDGLETGWSSRVWQTEDGLPAATVAGIIQTPEGYLWLATPAGLARFDGLQFEKIPIPIGNPEPIIRVMVIDRAGNFWLAEDGGTVARFGKGAPRLFTSADGLSKALALQIIETPDRNIWVGYSDGSLFRITPDDQVIPLLNADGIKDDGTCSLTLDARGVLWIAKGYQFGFWNGDRFENAGMSIERNPQILGCSKGGIWMCTSSQVLKYVSNAPPLVMASFENNANRVKPSVLFEDFAGRLWIGTAANGLFQLQGTHLKKINTSQNRILTLNHDRENSIWVGTDGGGLNRLRPQALELWGRDEGMQFETVRSLSEDLAGNLWVVTQDGIVTTLSASNWDSGRRVGDWIGGMAHCVVTDKKGAVWIGTYQRGLFRWQDGKPSSFNTHNGLADNTVRSLLVDSKDNLWIGLERGHVVQRLCQGQFQSYFLPSDCRAVRAIAEDTSGLIWLGTLDGRLFYIKNGKVEEMDLPDSEHAIRCLTATPDGSLWIGYAVKGISRLKSGKLTPIGLENGLFDGNICAVLPDELGRMWFASDRGIFYVILGQLNDFADGRATHVQSILFGRDAGIPSLAAYYGYWPGAVRTRNGKILFPTHSGIAIVHPDCVSLNTTPPRVTMKNFTVDGKTVAMKKEAGKIKLPANHRRIEIAFTAPSFVGPEQVRFRYRLEGWSDEWTEAGPLRMAAFPRLPAGNYNFHVIACNNAGVWNDAGDAVAFSVTPFFWQNWFFLSGVMLLVLTALVLWVRHISLRRVRLMMWRVEQETVLQRERARIAEDMHDELGARFTQISLLGELSRNTLPKTGPAHDYLSQISQVAQVGVKSLDEIVWAVNSRNDTLPDLLDYTGQYAREFASAAGLQCRLDFPETPPAENVSGEVRHAVFLIIKEALHNVVKHARASRVTLAFESVNAHMLWRIEDDGRGFEPAPDNALDDGLRNIRQRAAALGGQAQIESRPGTGTQVMVRIPLKKPGDRH